MPFHWKIGLVSIMTFGFAIGYVFAQRLTSNDIMKAGVTRLSDLIELSGEWVGTSTDGYHWTIAPLGSSWYQSPEWNLFIDGHPIHVQAFNQKELNELPITIGEICEVHFSSVPKVIHGMIALGGAIEIHRCVPESGLSLSGQVSAGNETGDPGPFKYTNSRIENVDRTGPTAHTKIAIASTNWYLQVGGATDEHHVTDPRIRPRVLQLYRGEKDARILSRSVHIDGKVFDYKVTAGASRVEDLVFLALMGREIPIDKAVSWISASNTQSRYGYSLMSSLLDLRTRENPDAVNIDFFQRQIHARGYTVISLPHTSFLELGTTGLLSQIRYGSSQFQDQIASLRIYGQFHFDELFGIYLKNLGAVSLDAGSVGFELFSHGSHARSRLSIQAFIRHRAPESKVHFASWVKQGYNADHQVIRILSHPLPRYESFYSTDLIWTTGNSIELRLTGGWRRYVNHIASTTESNIDSTQIGLEAITEILSTSGHVARISLGARMSVSKHLTFSASGVYMHPWSIQSIFSHAWPHRLLIGIRGEYQPNDRFSIDMRLRFIGQSTWGEYSEVALANPEFYAASLPSALNMHVTVQKRLWKNRLRISATVRNVLDHPYITHPAGARTRTLFQVAVSYAFRTKNILLP